MTTTVLMKEPCFRCGCREVVIDETDLGPEQQAIECFCSNCLLYATINKEDIA